MPKKLIQSSAEKLEEEIIRLLDAMADEDETPLINGSLFQSYEEIGMLTTDRGFVVLTEDGAEYQVTIKQTGRPLHQSEDER